MASPVAVEVRVDEAVDVGELLRTCEAAAAAAGRVIRAVQRARQEGGQAALGATLKDSDDPRSALTVADTAAQAVIMKLLREKWPHLTIIGEESDNEEDLMEGASAALQQAGAAGIEHACSGLEAPQDLKSVPPSALCIFLDPLDGTREFVEGRLDAVQTLVGVSVYGRARMGAIGLPFHGNWEAEREPVAVVSGIVGAGVSGVPPLEEGASVRESSGGVTLTASAGQPKGVLADVVATINAEHTVPLGGVGNKVLALVMGKADAGLMHLGTSLWDTCATEAVLRAAGGTVTDLHGCPIEHSHQAPTINRLGVIATAATYAGRANRSHQQLCSDIRALPSAAALMAPDGLVPQVGAAGGSGGDGMGSVAESQATDVGRDLLGRPLTAAGLSAAVGYAVESYDIPEPTACRFMMSEAVRVRLKATDAPSSEPSGCPKSLFYKRVVMGDLEHARAKAKTAPNKLARDVKSYQVEAAFLGSSACAALVKEGVSVARPYAVELRPMEESPIDSRFSLLLEDFASADGWRQVGFLQHDEMLATLQTAAQLHAFFWPGSRCRKDTAMDAEVTAAVWPAGAYYQPAMQEIGHLDKIQQGWAAFTAAFADDGHLAALEGHGVEVESFGARLSDYAPTAAAYLHEAGHDLANPHRTVIHGDFKSANVFLNQGTGSATNVTAALIDFQWAGWGLAGTDVAYLIATSASEELLPMDGSGEEELLKHYHSVLLQALQQFGVENAASIFPFEVLKEQYEVGIADLCRLATAYQWQRIKVSPAVLEANRGTLGRVAYNKSLHHALWLVVRTDQIMRARPWS